VSCPAPPAPLTIMNRPAGRAVYRFLRAASEQVEIVLCLLLVKDCNIGTAPNSHSSSWSCADLAEKFHSVPQALDTMVREGERSCERSRARQRSERRTARYSSPCWHVAM